MKLNLFYVLMIFPILISCVGNKSNKTMVRVIQNDPDNSVDIYFGDSHFTSYIYSEKLMKPCLWPVFTSEGTEITRGFPMKKIPGERFDHPHHVGIWMNYGDVNGIDYWGHSEATPENRKSHSGIIKHKEIVETQSGEGEGSLVVKTDWEGGGNIQIKEEITYHFIDRRNIRIIDWLSTLTAQEDIVFNDTKEGMFAIRVSRKLELPSNQTVILTDAHGNPTKVKAMNNELVSGDYLSSEGIKGSDVWGTRAKWMKLFGKYKEENVSVIIIDHKKNPGYPAYWHARGYGLFAVNALGQETFSKGAEKMYLKLKKGELTRFAYRTVICSGEISNEEIKKLTDEFSLLY